MRANVSTLLCCLLCVGAHAAGDAGFDTDSATGPNKPPSHWQSLAAEVVAEGLAAGSPGIGIVIFDAGDIVALNTSWAPDTPFRWGSITKTLTALSALSLCESGELALDDPVRKYLVEGVFHNPWESTRPLLLRHLLEQSAGLADLSGEEWDSNKTPAAPFRMQIRELLWPPGLQHSYSNVSPGLTAAVIEASSGRAFASVLRQRVLLPLGMMDASLDPLPGLPGGYRADGHTEIPYWHMTFPAFGALNASLPEMSGLPGILLQRGYRNGKRVFSTETIDALFAPGKTLGSAAGLQVGYGAGIYSWVSMGHQFWGHGGDADGYLSRFGLLPHSQRGYLLAINVDDPALLRRLQRQIEQALTADLSAPQAPAATTKPELQQFSGRYYPSAARFRVSQWLAGEAEAAIVTPQGEFLQVQRGTRSTLLIPLGQSRFRRADDPVVSVVFARDEDGSLFLQGELGNYVKSDQCPGFIPDCHQ